MMKGSLKFRLSFLCIEYRNEIKKHYILHLYENKDYL